MKWRLIMALIVVATSTKVSVAADPRFPDWPARRPRFRKSRSPRCGPGRRSTMSRTKWKDDARSQPWSRNSRRGVPSLMTPRRRSQNFYRARRPIRPRPASFCSPACSIRSTRSAPLSWAGSNASPASSARPPTGFAPDTLALQELQSAASPDQAKIDELGNQLTWETRIFEDRRRVVKFVCEVPTAIDQRLFALGRAIQQDIE